MDKTVTQETKDWLAKVFPFGDKWERRRVIKLGDPNAWYKVGDIITVKYFATFGAYDINDRWVGYYDLSLPIVREISEKEKKELITNELTRVNKALAYMNEWNDIPLAMQMDSLSKILEIRNDKAAADFCFGLLIKDRKDSAETLYNVRGHEFKEVAKKKSIFKRIFG